MTPSNVTRAGLRDYDAQDDHGQYLGSARTSLEAEVKANAHRLDGLRRGTAFNPYDLYAGAPEAAIACNVEALSRAYAHFLARHAERMERNGLQLEKRDQDKITESITTALRLVQQRAWQVHADGVLEIAGDRDVVYLVDHLGCFEKDHITRETGERAKCKSHQYHMRLHGGECKHIIARELIRLSQRFAAEVATPLTTEGLATATVGGLLLGHSLAILAMSSEAVTVQISDRRLRIASGDPTSFTHGVGLRVSTVGTAKVRLEPDAFLSLWSQFQPVVKSHATVELHVSSDAGNVTLIATDGTFSATVRGVAVA